MPICRSCFSRATAMAAIWPRIPTGAIYVSGTSSHSELCTRTPLRADAASLVKIDPDRHSARDHQFDWAGVEHRCNSCRLSNHGIAPGELISIVGQHLGPSTTVMAQLDATGRLPFQVDATSVSFDGYIAPLISVQDGLIVCFAPFEITGSAEVTVTVDGQKSNQVRVGVRQPRHTSFGDRQSGRQRQFCGPSRAARFGGDVLCHRPWSHVPL